MLDELGGYFRRSRSRLLAAGSLAALLIAPGCAKDSDSTAATSNAAQDTATAVMDGREISRDIHEQIAAARDSVFPALVHINVISVSHYGGKESKHRSAGSGTLISTEGYVLTNAHVTEDGVTYFCTLADKRRVPAKLVAEDPFTDLAVLKIAPADLEPSAKSIKFANFGDSDKLAIGDYVMAMGSPLALSRSVTLGVVSNTERILSPDFGDNDFDALDLGGGQRTGIFTTWIQHDALINPGNSGGPLVDLTGRIVGINTRGGAGLSYATPSNIAQTVAKALIEKGEVLRSWVGVSFRPIEDTGYTKGVLVDSTETDGPAAAAGIKPGDIVTSIGGDPITIRFKEQVPPLLKKLAEAPVGANVEVEYERNGQASKATIVTKKLLKDKGDDLALREWGMTIQRITNRMARYLRLPDTDGAYVNSVRSGSTAAKAEPAIDGGDIIRAIDGQPVKTPQDLVAYYEKIVGMEKPPEYVVVEYDRAAKNYLTMVKSKPDKDQDKDREVPKAWVGIATQAVLQKLADKLGSGSEAGFRITRVYPNTKAADSGLKVGDVITGLNGKKLKPRGMEDSGTFTREIKRIDLKPGEEVKADVTVVRAGESKTIPVVLEKSRIEPADARKDTNRDFDLTVREVTFVDRDDYRWDESISGVLVENVENAGWAGLGGIRPGDLIRRIDTYDVTSLEDYRKAMTEITKAKPKRVVFLVLRGIQTSFRFVEPEWGPGGKDKSKEPNTPKDEAKANGAEKPQGDSGNK